MRVLARSHWFSGRPPGDASRHPDPRAAFGCKSRKTASSPHASGQLQGRQEAKGTVDVMVMVVHVDVELGSSQPSPPRSTVDGLAHAAEELHNLQVADICEVIVVEAKPQQVE